GVARIALEQVVAHGDELDRRATAGLQVSRQAVDEIRPVLAAERLDHLDADDRVELARSVAIILLAENDAGMLATRPGQLLVGQADRRHLATLAGKVVRQRAPAAADLEKAGGFAEPFSKAIPLTPLRRFQAVMPEAPAARIAHRR